MFLSALCLDEYFTCICHLFLCRPIVFSIDDNRDYQANFVLATLLDESTPSQPQLSTAQTHTTATAEKPEKRVHTHNGHHSQSIHEATASRDQSSHLDEDTMEQGVSSDRHFADAGQTANGSRKSKPNSSRRKGLNTNDQSGVSRTLHVSTPPDPSLMEQSPPACRTSSTGRSQNEGTLRVREPAGHLAQDYDPVDVLFEMNEDEMELGFGEAAPADSARNLVVDRTDSDSKSHGIRTKKHVGVSKRHTANTGLPDDDFYSDDFPYQGE